MRKNKLVYRVIGALFCVILSLCAFCTTSYAAKENFLGINHIGICNCAVPMVGEYPDLDVTSYAPGRYTVTSVSWYKGSNVTAASEMSEHDVFMDNSEYTVVFEVEAKASSYFNRDSNGYTTVTAGISEGSGSGDYVSTVTNVYGKDNSKYLSVRYTFSGAGKKIIESVVLTGLEEPYAEDRAKYPVVSLPENVEYLTDSDHYYIDVCWYYGTNKMSNLDKFVEGETYACHISLKAASGYEFKSDPNHIFASSGYPFPTVAVTINGKSATVIPNNDIAPGNEAIICSVQFVCKPSRKIKNVEISGVTDPLTDASPRYSVTLGSTAYGLNKLNNYAYVDGVAWKDKSGTLMRAAGDKYQPSTAYTVEILLEAKEPHVFDYTLQNAALTTATVNGKEAVVSASPDGDKYLIVRYTFKRTASYELSKVEINDLEVPKVGNFPDYTISYGATSYTKQGGADTDICKNGVLWYCNTTQKDMKVGVDKFVGGYTYTAYVMLSTTGGYEFKFLSDTEGYTVSGKINGKSAQLEECNDTDATIYYTFTVDRVEVKSVEIKDIAAPKHGESPDYTMTLGASSYAPYYTSDNDVTKNSIIWCDDTTQKDMKVGVDKFIGGHKYSVIIILKTTGVYTFGYVPATDSYTVTAKINGKSAVVEECNDKELTIYYEFTCAEPEHKCSPLKVDEYKATCKETGRKAYYFCPECSRNFEDSKCTKEIADINNWGQIPKTAHTGGKATCKEKAKCTVCSAYYGELGEHNYGSGWEYKDAQGHAHVCRVCGAHDTVVAHSGGSAECGKVSKCAECKAEYGEVMQHRWSSTPTYKESKGHAYQCTLCGEHDTVQAHSGGTADCQNKAKCSACGTPYGKTGEHKWSTGFEYKSSAGHAHACTVSGCSAHDSVITHTAGPEATETSAQTCTVCNYVIKPSKQHVHKMVRVSAVNATCTTAGISQHFKCEECGAISSDVKCENLITDEDSLIIAATGHKESRWKKDADYHWKECTAKGCGVIIEDTKCSHDFGDNNKCQTCNYRKGDSIEEDTDDMAWTDTAPIAPDDSSATTENTDVTTGSGEADGTSDESISPDTDDSSENKGGALWIVIIGIVIAVAGAMVAVTLVVLKKNKRA